MASGDTFPGGGSNLRIIGSMMVEFETSQGLPVTYESHPLQERMIREEHECT